MRKLSRIFWILYYRILFRYRQIPYGKSIRICNKIYFKCGRNCNITIGDNFGFSSGGGYNPLARNIMGAIEIEDNAKLIIGDGVGISSSCLWVYDYLTIGSRTKIGGDCIILDSDAHSLNYLERGDRRTDRPNAIKKGIVIEEDVLIGARSIILKGVTIGARSIVGSGSVVTKSIPSDEIWAGNPVKFIRKMPNSI